MLKVTSQQLTDAVGIDSEQVGRPVIVGSVQDGNINAAGNAVLKVVPKGFVVLATKFVVQPTGLAGISGALGTKDTTQGSPQVGSGGTAGQIVTDFESEVGSPAFTMTWQRQARYNTLFGSAASPDWRTAPPANVIQWSPKYPVVIPSGWTVNTGNYTGYGEWAAGQAIYGLLVSEDQARTLGFAVTSNPNDAKRNASVVSGSGDGSTQTLLAGRTGKSIRILDVQIRLQAPTNTLTTVELRQADGSRSILKLCSSNPAELIDKSLSPDIFLKGGSGLQLVTNDADACSVNVSYEFVDEEEVPGDYFWGYLEPQIYTPGDGTVGTVAAQVFTQQVEKLTLYYPRLDTLGLTATKTTAGKNKQHLLRGFCISAQKEGTSTGTTDSTDQQFFALSQAADSSTLTAVYHLSGSVNIAGDNVNAELASAGMAIGNHDQNLTIVTEGLNAPGPEDGVVRLDIVNMSATPNTVLGAKTTPTDGDMTAWAVTVWGRTIPSRFTAPINRTS